MEAYIKVESQCSQHVNTRLGHIILYPETHICFMQTTSRSQTTSLGDSCLTNSTSVPSTWALGSSHVLK